MSQYDRKGFEGVGIQTKREIGRKVCRSNETNVSRVSDQNGVSRLYIEGSQPEWCISSMIHI